MTMRTTGNALTAPVASGSSKGHTPAQTTGVGRSGTLALEYVRQGNRTVLGRTRCQTPWHLLPPIYLDESGSAYTLLVNPSGGLVGGDHLSVDLSIGPGASALISTPSANRVYRSPSQEAVQEVTIAIGAQGILEWIPEHTIPYAGSRFRQSIEVRMGAGATLLLWDAVASGRIAHGERWRFASLDNRIQITLPSGAAVGEHYAVAAGESAWGVGTVEAWDYVGSLFIVGDGVSATRWTTLEATLWEILDNDRNEGILGGVSQPAVPGLAVKLVATSAPIMTRVLMDLWAAVRHSLWQLPPAILRKY
jgi:urease accessory protein